jgi:hypothetical protein
MAVLRHVYRWKQQKYYAVYDTATYGRNTVPTERLFHGSYTVVIIMYPNVYVRVNDGKLSFAIVVVLDLGISFVWKYLFPSYIR